MIPCLSSDLAKNNKIMSMFVLFSRILGRSFCKFDFFRKWGGGGGGKGGKPYTKAVKQDIFSQFFKSTTKVAFFSENPGYFDCEK